MDEKKKKILKKHTFKECGLVKEKIINIKFY